LKAAVFLCVTVLAWAAAMYAAAPAPGQEAGANSFGALSRYLGSIVQQVDFPGLPTDDETELRNLIPLKAGNRLDRQSLRQTLQRISATRRFADIEVDAERTSVGAVILRILTKPNFFVGQVLVYGVNSKPSANQVVNASKLELGHLFQKQDMDATIANIKPLMEENGYYLSTVTAETRVHPQTQQVDVLFHVSLGAQAHVGQVTVTGNPGFSQGQIQDIAKMHPGDTLTADRVNRALDRIRKKYRKQNRLTAQVAIVQRSYQAPSNSVNFDFRIDPGPIVNVEVQGFKVSRGVIKQAVPVYEEGAFDEDLLNEGKRNLLNYMQTRGYFDAKVALERQPVSAANEIRVNYVIDPGLRHKLAKVTLVGNHYFASAELLSRLQVFPAARFRSYGRFSQGLLSDDVRTLQAIYQANGFERVKVAADVQDNYEGKGDVLAVTLRIDENEQTLVGGLRIQGNEKIPASGLPVLTTEVGQPYSQSNIATDRELILGYYFNRGFPDADFDASEERDPNDPRRVNVVYTIHEGRQVFVDEVLISGLEHTRPYVVQRELEVKPDSPLSQQDMLNTQRRLYDLGIFSQVNTAIQNPQGQEPTKNVLIDLQEAKRYTFDYGIGLEFQTGTPSVNNNQPQGQTGISPRVSFGVTRLNLRGRDQTATFKFNLGRLQQRVLFSYDLPRVLNSENWKASFTAFYDNTLDVTTFTSERLEGSVQAQETISRATSMIYRFTYRRVKASNIVISPDEIPVLSLPVRVGMPGFTYIRDTRDNPLESTRGTYNTMDAGVASGIFGSEADFSRWLFQNSTYYAFGKNRPAARKYVLARSTRLGLENAFNGTVILPPGEQCSSSNPNDCPTVIPLPERFLSGGGNSHRGFGLNQAGPRDPVTGFPLGGSALFLNNLELRLPPTTLPYFDDNISFTIFHDMGNVFTSGDDMLHSFLHWRQPNTSLCTSASTATQCSYNYISHAIGVGIRYKTPIGPVRFDLGYNLNPPVFPSTDQTTGVFASQRLRHFNVYFSIGQTF
jgi:outer membrane protein assembly complex protein YaeT